MKKKTITVRVTDEQYTTIATLAEKNNISMEKYLLLNAGIIEHATIKDRARRSRYSLQAKQQESGTGMG